MTSILKTDDLASSIISAAELARESSVAVMVALAPIAGMVPDAFVTGLHIYVAFGGSWAGIIAALVVTPGVLSIGIGLAYTRSILPLYGLESEYKKIDAAYWFAVLSIAVVNIFMAFRGGWSSVGMMLSALALLPIPVSVLIATTAKIGAVIRATNDSTTREFENGERAKDNENRRKIEFMQAKKAAELAQVPPQVVQVVEQVEQVATKKPRGRVDLVVLARELEQDSTRSNEELGKLFNVSGEAVRLAKMKISG